VKEHEQRRIALCTVPVILKHGTKRLQVNCFLDEGSDTTYVNEDVVKELGLEGQKERVTINVANDQKVDLISATMEIGLESLDGRVDCGKNIAQYLWWDETNQLVRDQRSMETFEEHPVPKTGKEKQDRRAHWFGLSQFAISHEGSSWR